MLNQYCCCMHGLSPAGASTGCCPRWPASGFTLRTSAAMATRTSRRTGTHNRLRKPPPFWMLWKCRRRRSLASSSGGYVAQQLAVEYSNRVAALMLVGAPLTLQGRPPFAADVESLTDPVTEDSVRGFLIPFPSSRRGP